MGGETPSPVTKTEVNLTKAQREFLERSARRSYEDGTGTGAVIHDGRVLRTARALVARGLIYPLNDAAAYGHHLHGARITPAGRLALQGDTPHAE